MSVYLEVRSHCGVIDQSRLQNTDIVSKLYPLAFQWNSLLPASLVLAYGLFSRNIYKVSYQANHAR